ncbi:hypothetical protein KL867_17720 [Ruegeria litorea]|uniref:PhiE125 gp8 family phage protein n=1 Tax=Falsiruegeria litorea TaxID=1280831 RepID=A0ABS5WUT8_9RHOB|nr:hypothetical protein [Falsiruegeria litorea]MBT3142911.1 hypothetical protein [Falsiruegeria litorea]
MRVIETNPVSPGVSLDSFKGAIHIALEDLDDDAALKASLSAAEAVVATATGRPLVSQNVEFVVTRGSWRRWWFPVLPVLELLSLAVDDGVGGWLDQPLSGAWVQQAFDEPQLVLNSDWAGHGLSGDLLRVQARVGGDAANHLPQLRQAIILLAKEWFEAGVAIDGQDVPKMSFGVHRLIKQVRYRRPLEQL